MHHRDSVEESGHDLGVFVGNREMRDMTRVPEDVASRSRECCRDSVENHGDDGAPLVLVHGSQNVYEATSSKIRGCRIADGFMNFVPDCIVRAVTMLLLAAL
jgi:hypothetical protein